jgi:hypothetical protein
MNFYGLEVRSGTVIRAPNFAANGDRGGFLRAITSADYENPAVLDRTGTGSSRGTSRRRTPITFKKSCPVVRLAPCGSSYVSTSL